MHPGPTRAAEAIVDQEQTQTDGTGSLIGDYLTGQIFTVGTVKGVLPLHPDSRDVFYSFTGDGIVDVTCPPIGESP